ncbi:MAG: hypothetical protein M3O70_05140 [Actinomycetota bacterium]|nr:hypothetical protein [Actinomycetota bacterium]
MLARWFVITMLVLTPIGLAVIAWAFLSVSRPRIEAAARRPPGSATVTHERGEAALNQVRIAEAGPGCSSGIVMLGDDSARAILRRALGATCQLLAAPEYSAARDGLSRWASSHGIIRLAVFELTGVDGSARVEDGRIVVELNAKFQFEQGARAAPVIIHELVHFAQDMPGRPVTAEGELAAMEAQKLACERLVFDEESPRACRDAGELLASPDPLARLEAAGYKRSDTTSRLNRTHEGDQEPTT